MNTFADSAATFIDSRPDAKERREAWSVFEALGLPTVSDEVWRYAPLGEFGLEHFSVPSGPAPRPDSEFATQLGQRAGLVVRVIDGFCVDAGSPPAGVRIEVDQSNDSLAGESLLRRYESDTFALLNAALAPGTTLISVDAGVAVAEPIVVLNESTRGASFPRTQIVLGRGSSVTVVEYFEGGEDALVVPVSEYRLGDNASLRLITYQRLDATAWHVARTTGLLVARRPAPPGGRRLRRAL